MMIACDIAVEPLENADEVRCCQFSTKKKTHVDAFSVGGGNVAFRAICRGNSSNVHLHVYHEQMRKNKKKEKEFQKRVLEYKYSWLD